MAYYFIFPEKDTTIYSHPNRTQANTGRDEILELIQEKGTSNSIYHPSRILIKFSDSDIKTSLDKIPSSNFSASLQLFSTEHENLAINHLVEVFPLSSSWTEGTGRYSNLPTSSNGSSWLYKDSSTQGTKWRTSSFNNQSTGSINDSVGIPLGGGEWYKGDNFKGSQSFSNADDLDLNIDITSIVKKYSASLYDSNTVYPNGIPNHGFIIKNSDNIEEFTSGSNGNLQYFSADTHTIYPPKLVFKWDDSTHTNLSTAGSETNIFTSTANSSSEHINVSLTNTRTEYNQDEETTFRLHVRKKYPQRQFVSGSNFIRTGFLKTSSYYSIRDAHTEEIIIPFDNNCTKLSSDSDGMYFKLYMNGLQPERYYRILIKHVNTHGTTIFDDNYHFKVVR